MRSVLFVDDEESILHAVRQLFSDEAGMRLLVASSGEEALGIVRSEDVWLVVSDNHMPGLKSQNCTATTRFLPVSFAR